MQNTNQPIMTLTQRARLKNAGLDNLLSFIDNIAASLDDFVEETAQDKVHTDLWKQNVVNETAAKAMRQLESQIIKEMDPINDVTGRQRKKIDDELQLKGELDAVILQSATQVLLDEKLSVQEIIATNDPDLLRAALVLPSGKHLVLKGDTEKMQIIEEAMARHTLGEEGYAKFAVNDRKLGVLRDVWEHIEKLKTEFANKSVGIKKQLGGVA